MEPQCTHLHREYKPVHNVNAIRQHLECKSQQSTFGMQTHTMRKPVLCTSKQCTSSVWLPCAFRGLVGATCPACSGWLRRPGCCMVATCRTTELFSLDVVGNVLVAYFEWSAAQLLRRLLCGPVVLLPGETPSSLQQHRQGSCCVPETCAHEIFCCMLFAVPFLLTSNGQRVKILPQLLCVPARLLPACSIESSWFPEARLVLRSRVVRARIFLLYVVRRACLTYLQWPAVETFSPASVCSCSPASSRLCMLLPTLHPSIFLISF